MNTRSAADVCRSQTVHSDYGVQISYRTLSIRIDETQEKLPPTPKDTPTNPEAAIGQVDVHTISIDDVFTRYSTSPTIGLERAAVQRRAKTGGKNVISPPKTQYRKKIANYIFGGFNFLMWIAFIFSLATPNPPAFNLGIAILLLLVIIVSAAFYAVVDWSASRIMSSVKTLIAANATVIRDGEQQTISARDVVVGDVLLLSMGDRVPADIRIVKASSDLRFDRSLLTGESDMIPGALDMTSPNALETRNLALTSTFVVQGTCTGVVYAIGDKSAMGRIVAMSGETKFKLTTVQREVWFLTKIVSAMALTVFCTAIIIWAAWLRTSYPGYETASQAMVNSIGCLTSFAPGGLPVAVALSLTIVAKKMAKRHVLVKNLATVETLGCMSVLCSDKTGTLTVGKMSVQNVAFVDSEHRVDDLLQAEAQSSSPSALQALHMIARLCNGARFEISSEDVDAERKIKGDATDSAVLAFAESIRIPSLQVDSATLLSTHEKLFEIPFNSRNKWMLSVVRASSKEQESTASHTWMLVKGAPDVLFPACTNVMRSDGSVAPMDISFRRQLFELQEAWSSQGQRVLALCRRSLDDVKWDVRSMPANDVEELMYSELQGLTLVGLLGIRDPPRADVPGAVATIRRAGVRVFMVTGDFKATALAIARQVGITTQDHVDTIDHVRFVEIEKAYANVSKSQIKPSEDDPIRSLVLTGDDLLTLEDCDWDVIVGRYTEVVFARTTPEQKLRIVEEIKARGDNTVAVTGDGVNDAPALKASDIGVAMGSGSDVAKEAADMVLLNNDFSSIVVAIQMGRLVFDNLRKVLIYLMPAGSYTEAAAVFTNVFFGMQLPLSSYLQVCFDVLNDVVMSITLMYEKPEADLMQRKPRNARTDRLANWRFFIQVYLFIGLMMWPCCMSMWFLYMHQQGLGFYDVLLVYNKWTDGYKGFSIDQLTHFVSVGQCIFYVSMVISQYGGLLAVRNRRVSILQSNPLWGPRQNLSVFAGMAGTALVAIVSLYGPGLQRVFGTAPIPAMFWGIPFAFAAGILLMDEIRKLLVRAYPKSIIAKMAW
ncbi:calcium ATPase transmembrane domain M-containing protein [Fomitopsis schrenkii]|uniref:Calcium ATPase transmembrane domain M-containing protein n=1 Tax=Fomitopsis schrenkii TaxID=2126942 RepID=S8ESD7_FOMSC|nr:calcium ATPase transmembrane domain M-containing protein [Fomitopsis schrenkii]